jgi:hypothetical protein
VPEPQARNALRDALVTWLVVELLVAVLMRLPWTLPLVDNVGHAAVSFVFLYAPMFLAKRRGEYIEDYGFRLEPLKRSLLMAGIALVVIAPLFAGGYVAFYELACKSATLLARLPVQGMCALYGGLSSLHAPRLELEYIPVQLIVVAIPEELFFRGFLLGLLEQRFPPKRRWLGGGIGWALLISSLAFAAVHLPRDNYDPRALMTFFPGLLFGWMKSSTKSITASTVTHAGSNLLVHLLDLSLHHA